MHNQSSHQKYYIHTADQWSHLPDEKDRVSIDDVGNPALSDSTLQRIVQRVCSSSSIFPPVRPIANLMNLEVSERGDELSE